MWYTMYLKCDRYDEGRSIIKVGRSDRRVYDFVGNETVWICVIPEVREVGGGGQDHVAEGTLHALGGIHRLRNRIHLLEYRNIDDTSTGTLKKHAVIYSQ